MEALSFSFRLFKNVISLKKTKKKALVISFLLRITAIRKVQIKEDIAIIVDVDDKNCLAQLTVVPEPNQGVRQWPYIIGGVLFFVTFFCTSKRK